MYDQKTIDQSCLLRLDVFSLNQFVTSVPVLPIHVFALVNTARRDQSQCYTVKSHFKALGLYNFIRGFGWACMYKRRGGGELISGQLISGIKTCFGTTR